MSWVGGSNYIDSPHAVAQRCVAAVCDPDDTAAWEDFGDGAGDVQVRVTYPEAVDLPAYRAGQFEWLWEANFEAFASDIGLPTLQGDTVDATPAGTYRFVIEGQQRTGTPPAAQPYRLVSDPFQVQPWSGIEIVDLRIDDEQTVSFGVGPVSPYPPETTNTRLDQFLYPDSYESEFPYIDGERTLRTYRGGWAEWFRLRCSFRPWADTGAVTTATVRALAADDGWTWVEAGLVDGRWVAQVPEGTFEVDIGPGQVQDTFGNGNGQSASIRLPSAS